MTDFLTALKWIGQTTGSLLGWTLFCIILFHFNPWSAAVDWIQKVRGKPPIFKKEPTPRTSAKSKKRIATGERVYVATATVDGNVVQKHVVAASDEAAKSLAAERLHVEEDTIDVTEVFDEVAVRR